jgi:DME family drug/metabolite transporter
MHQEPIGILSLLGAAMLWGTCGTAQTFAPPGFDPMVVGMMRIAIGGTALMVFAVLRQELGSLSDWPIKWTLLGAGSVAAFQLFFFEAVHQAGVAVGTIVGLGSAPVIAGVLSLLVFGERPGRRWWIATFLAINGCSLLTLAGQRMNASFSPVGLLLAIAAGASYALYALSVKQLVARQSSLAVMAVLGCLGALMLVPILVEGDFSWIFGVRGGGVVIYLGLFSYALPMFLFAYGLSVTPVPTAVTLTLAEPLTAGLLGVLVVGEYLTGTAWCGLFLLLCGLFLLAFPWRKSKYS